MAEKSKIEWTDATWNPITGCAIKSSGCAHCYAMKLAGTRLRNHPSRVGLTDPSRAGPIWNGKVRFNQEWLTQPLGWTRSRMVFVCAHADLFYEEVPDEWIDKVFAIMWMAKNHTFQVLTKRSARMRSYLNAKSTRLRIAQQVTEIQRKLERGIGTPAVTILAHIDAQWPLGNVWVGVSAERQKEADERIPDLLGMPAAIRFVSLEPLLGPIDMLRTPRIGEHHDWLTGEFTGAREKKTTASVDWVIVGGENGPRPTHPAWVRSLRAQLGAAGKLDRFFFKQWGTWVTEDQAPEDIVLPAMSRGMVQDAHRAQFFKVGKKAAGRLLDGIEHNGMPFT